MKKAAIFILLGQSNAVGHGIPMAPEDRIETPLTRVFGLHRNQNQRFDLKKLTWTGYTSGGMNLGETQDHTYSIANCLARLWEDSPENLPPLYIVHIAIGAQGITEKYMWHPEREPKLIPGPLGTADISLTPLTCHILRLLAQWVNEEHIDPQFLGLHWRGGEEDIAEPTELLQKQLPGYYRRMFAQFTQALGQEIPIILHRFPYEKNMATRPEPQLWRRNMALINSIFDCLGTVFDVRSAPHYDPSLPNDGLFIEDLIHYNPQTNRYVAEEILKGAVSCTRFPFLC